MKILVTGGAGFFGSCFVETIMQYDSHCEVVVLDSLTYAGDLENISPDIRQDTERFSFYYGDVCNAEIVNYVMEGVDVVVHFAAESHVTRSIYDNQRFFMTDVIGTQVVATAALKHKVKHFIHISTSEVYGTAEYAPMDEKHPLNPRSPYAAAKAGADRLVYSYMQTYGLPATILRPFNQYGPKQHLEKVIPQFIYRAMNDDVLQLHGGGQATRDWQYVYDSCNKIRRIINNKAAIGEIFNIGSGEEISIEMIAKKIVSVVGSGKIEVRGERNGQVMRHVSSTQKYDMAIGKWEQLKFNDMIPDVVNWYQMNDSWKKHEWMKDVLLERN
jgi:dTDP-glucose 4,6-dehydratase